MSPTPRPGHSPLRRLSPGGHRCPDPRPIGDLRKHHLLQLSPHTGDRRPLFSSRPPSPQDARGGACGPLPRPPSPGHQALGATRSPHPALSLSLPLAPVDHRLLMPIVPARGLASLGGGEPVRRPCRPCPSTGAGVLLSSSSPQGGRLLPGMAFFLGCPPESRKPLPQAPPLPQAL